MSAHRQEEVDPAKILTRAPLLKDLRSCKFVSPPHLVTVA
jgi:hypothetical protein